MAREPLLHRRTFLVALTGGTAASLRRVASGHAQSSSAQRWPALQKLLSEWVAARKIAGGVVALSFDREPFAYLAAGRIALDSPIAFDENSSAAFIPARVRSDRQSLSNCANAARTPSINLPVDVSSIGSVAERSEMPKD